MPDDADNAQLLIDEALARALAAKKPVTIQAKGACHWCDEPVTALKLYCSTDCRADWERDQRLRQRI